MKSLLWWIVRGVAIIVFALGVLFVVIDLLDVEKGALIPGIIMAVVGLVVAIFAGKKKDSAKNNKVRKALKKCKKCGGEYSSQYEYTYNLGSASKSPYSGLLVVTGTITFTCTKCGKHKILAETFEIAGVRPEEEIKKVVEDKVRAYIG